jgi:hypothetical protein
VAIVQNNILPTHGVLQCHVTPKLGLVVSSYRDF